MKARDKLLLPVWEVIFTELVSSGCQDLHPDMEQILLSRIFFVSKLRRALLVSPAVTVVQRTEFYICNK